MKEVLCFGNEFVKEDAMAKRLADVLEKDGVRFMKCDKVEDVLAWSESHPGEELIILDVVKGISNPIEIEDLSMIKTTDSVTLHDFDLAFFLKLLDATGQIGKVRIIGLPMEGDLEKLKSQVERML